jgi:hypothetical protein
VVAGGDLMPPAHNRAAELTHLGRTVLVLEICAEPGYELKGEVGSWWS